MLKMVLTGAGLVATAAVAVAQTSDGSGKGATTRHGPSGAPTEVVCVRQQQIGSRLATRRVCRTRAEWEQHQAEFKQEVERAQQQMQTDYDG
ncbi:MAG TPA: hypothetical protein VF704_03665 [Allosphingosinicella sp.]|jgi:hypothetical protein